MFTGSLPKFTGTLLKMFTGTFKVHGHFFVKMFTGTFKFHGHFFDCSRALFRFTGTLSEKVHGHIPSIHGHFAFKTHGLFFDVQGEKKLENSASASEVFQIQKYHRHKIFKKKLNTPLQRLRCFPILGNALEI